MRTARATVVGLGLVLALAPAEASAEPPRVSARLDYARGPGGEACPAEPTSLRAEVTRRMGYDPFARTDAPERLTVSVLGQDGGFRARVERFNAAGVSTWSETFPARPLHGDCAALFSPLASYVFGLFLTSPGQPVAPGAPPPEPVTPVLTPPPAPPPELRAPPSPPPKPPEPADVPNPARVLPTRVAIVSGVLAGAFLGLATAWSLDAQSKARDARTLAGQSYAGATYGCTNGQAPSGYCIRLLGAWHSEDKAIELRNGWFSAAGVFGAVGVAATFWALNLPATIKATAQAQIAVRPGGLVIHGSF